MAERERMNTTNRAYQYGTAAPKLVPEKIRTKKSEYMMAARQDLENRVNSKRKTRAGYSLLQTAVIVFSAALILAAATFYILTLSRTEDLKAEIKTAKKTYQTLLSDNAIEARKVENTVDYAAVYEYATVTLGMQQPEKQQIVYYSDRPSEFVMKVGEIPND